MGVCADGRDAHLQIKHINKFYLFLMLYSLEEVCLVEMIRDRNSEYSGRNKQGQIPSHECKYSKRD